MQKVEVNLMGGQPNGHALTILEGKALEQKPPQKIKIDGDITSVSRFLKIRKGGNGHEHQEVDHKKAIVIVDKKQMFIHLDLDPGNAYNTEVTGTLELSDELLKWGINEEKYYKLADLVKMFRFNKLDFDVHDQQDALLKAYMQFNIKSFIEMEEQVKDSKGNRKSAFEKSVDFKLPTLFTLNIPVFKGFPSNRFNVEICLQPTDSSVNFWFESIELHELIRTNKEQIFNDELKSCEGMVIINQ